MPSRRNGVELLRPSDIAELDGGCIRIWPGNYSAYTVAYCPTCQTGGKILADNVTSKFLK